jgi:hypothetical protein
MRDLVSGCWLWYININITILDIIHCTEFYLKNSMFQILDYVSVFKWNTMLLLVCGDRDGLFLGLTCVGST